jgi:2-polyprenyl-3-methyl-5-hydroxy-6-metoxy-1,4-benzoquinol methylase
MLDVTGERLLPDQQRGELVHAEHLARYGFAAGLAAGLRVLDAASGEGYGTEMIARGGAKSVVGVDLDPKAVEHARERYGLEFREADVGALPFEDGSFDLVVSFETIEHVKDGERTVSEFHRVLTDDGLLVISTPNKSEYLMSTDFHEREYTTDEFRALLNAKFEDVRFYFQQNWLLSAVLREEQSRLDDPTKPVDLELGKLQGHEPGRELYTIALCGSKPPPPAREVGTITGVFEAHQLATRVENAERLLKEWNERALEAERLVTAWNERALEAERIQADTERQLRQKEAKLEQIETSRSWRMTAPLRNLMSKTRRDG